jgi:hypothetical protein
LTTSTKTAEVPLGFYSTEDDNQRAAPPATNVQLGFYTSEEQPASYLSSVDMKGKIHYFTYFNF